MGTGAKGGWVITYTTSVLVIVLHSIASSMNRDQYVLWYLQRYVYCVDFNLSKPP